MSRNELQYAGDFHIDELRLVTVKGNSFSLKDAYSSLEIYEDILSNSITGTLSFQDTNALVRNGPIIGQERLYLKIFTPQNSPNEKTIIDFTKNVLYVNKVLSVTDVNDGTQAVTVSFTTQDAYMNNRVRVSQSFKDEPSEIVKKILRDPQGLNSKKKLFFEKTSNLYKMVMPNIKPFHAINLIAQRSMSVKHQFAPSYLFYETCFGFHFRSLDNLFDRPTVTGVYREHTPGARTEDGDNDNKIAEMENIISYNINQSQDTLSNLMKGLYSSNIIIYDWQNKKRRTMDLEEELKFDYLKNFPKEKHTNTNGNFGSPNPLLSEALETDESKKMTEYPMSTQFVQSIDLDPTETFYTLQDEGGETIYDGNNIEKWLMKRRSRLAQIDAAIKVEVEVVGTTRVQAGDLISLEIPNKSSSSGGSYDETMSGRYLVKQLRHSFMKNDKDPKHTCYMLAIKDDVAQPFSKVGTGPGGTALTDAGPATDEQV